MTAGVVLYVVARGVTQLDNVIYVVCWGSTTIDAFTADTLRRLPVKCHVKGMSDPRDIVVCCDDRQLYVAECDCIWRVTPDDHSHVKWMTSTDSTTDTFHVYTLSLTSQHLLVTSSRPPTVRQYDTTDKQLLCVVQLPWYVMVLHHAVETTHGTFVVGHQGTSQDELLQCEVSELLRFCHILQH